MPSKLFPFLHEIDEGTRTSDIELTGEERESTDQDWQDCKYMIDYRRDSGWDKQAKRGMRIYNVVQTMKPEDEVSRIFIGGTRTMIDKGIEQMTEGEPDFSFEPFGPSDHIKTIVWKHMIKMILSNCEYKMHQETFFRDYFVMGSGVFEIFIDYPKRTYRIQNSNVEGGFEQIVVPDYRYPKVGIRAVNPMNCWRNPNIDSPTRVPSCLRKRTMTWNQFAQEFGRCTKADGSPMYDNLDKIKKGSHIAIFPYQDEIRDILRIYVKSYGNESDGFAKSPPMDEGLGIRILNTSLKIHEKKKDGIVYRSTGLNIPGMCSLRWGTFFDAYDKNYEGDHSVYGMGLPQRLEGEDTALQTIFNMNLDNYRWSQTVALNYEGNDPNSYMDLDANRLYGGELIDGEITPQPLGIARINDYQAMKETLDNDNITATGINHKQIVGDTSKTAYEFAQRIRQSNRSAEQRLTRLESEIFRPAGRLLLANALTVLTTSEYEAMTEEEVSAAKESIKLNKRPLSDYKDLNSDNPQRKRIEYIPMKGEKLREDFTVSKKRKLDYNAGFDQDGKSYNTLIPDHSMKVETSYIPLVEEYVYPAEYIESGILPDCIVDSKRMLGDMKAQDVQNFQAATNFILELIKLGYKKADLDKIVGATLEFANIDPKMILNTDEESSQVLSKVKDMISKMEDEDSPPTPPLNVQASPQVPAPTNAGTPVSGQGGNGSPQNALEATASSTI
jgi:hypothetical protein